MADGFQNGNIQGPWIAPVLLNGWIISVANSPAFGAPRFCKIGNQVFLQGALDTGTPGTVGFILPVGYRPVANGVMVAAQNGTGSTAAANFVQIAPDGTVTIQASGAAAGLIMEGSFIANS